MEANYLGLDAFHVRLSQKPQERLASRAVQFLGVQRPIMIRIGGAETLFDESQILVLCQRTVVIGIGRGQLFRRQSPHQFVLVQRAVLVVLKLVEQRRGRSLGFAKIDGAVIVGVEQAYQAAMPGFGHGR